MNVEGDAPSPVDGGALESLGRIGVALSPAVPLTAAARRSICASILPATILSSANGHARKSGVEVRISGWAVSMVICTN